ncbi:MAG: hypothetical protein OXU86_01280 [Thaumarchaeota archaeon]|nr:hypothetical protein [Nitrososphaerota archaeon]RNJ72212.1 MAG: hypothetical protein EB833_05335 [Thaumarchaeota archaeon S13]RNJ75334.1 MAG: hypothetical protein EB824_01830 [Thaumarchaeota archaeon S15]MDD9808630.1 hypothetical protein [Nitrososphaerota archaeon]MDD9814096.1 hypothetical protein [Nitrososphaerota archaeon]
MERPSRRRVVLMAVIALGALGGWQYVAATGISVSIAGSELVGSDERGSTYALTVAVENPTIIPIAVGKTDFVVVEGSRDVGSGTIEAFVMPAMGSTVAGGEYLLEAGSGGTGSGGARIVGVTSYDVLFASISIPFEYDTAVGFIHGA